MAVMDQHRDTLTTNGRREARIHWQAETLHLQDQRDEFHKTMKQLQALQSEYTELLARTKQNLEDARDLLREANAFCQKC